MNQGEIWLINLDPTIGTEIKKIRPAIVVNDNTLGRLPLKIIVPITNWKENYSIAPWMIKIEPDNLNNLDKISAIDCFQVRSISDLRFVRQIGKIEKDVLEQIKEGLAKVLSINLYRLHEQPNTESSICRLNFHSILHRIAFCISFFTSKINPCCGKST